MSLAQSPDQQLHLRPDSSYTAASAYPAELSEFDGAAESAPEDRNGRHAAHNNAGRSVSTSSTKVDPPLIVAKRGNSTSKRAPGQRVSVSHRSSKRSIRAGSLKGMGDNIEDGFNNVFNVPIPTNGTPTETLANRFQAWRKFLKDLIAYYREVQTSYEQRSKALMKLSNVIANTRTPPELSRDGGLDNALSILRNYHKLSLAEANKAREIEDDVITQLNGLRGDLSQKVKEIKSLSGDFKNSVDKEKDATRRAVDHLKDSLALAESEPSAASGKGDPFIVRLAVDRQVEKQIAEENYLHNAYLNLEGSGRELESIIVGEIQKAYNAYAGILKREADHAFDTVEQLRSGPLAIPKDHEWESFVDKDPHLIDPELPLRKLDNVYYPGKFTPAAAEIRGGNLERKSKYLKSYTPGWYVLSPTHLHEFKSADHIQTQTPVMSLCLLDQKLGSHSQPGASSHKFSLKGRQTGAMHRGHAWVFRAESYDTMMAWYNDITSLTEKTGEDKMAFVRKHTRNISVGSRMAPSMMTEGMGEDEADQIPFAAHDGAPGAEEQTDPTRPEPGGRFPSDIDVSRGLQANVTPSMDEGNFNHNSGDAFVSAHDLQPDQDYAERSHDELFNNEAYAHPVMATNYVHTPPNLNTGIMRSAVQSTSQSRPQSAAFERRDRSREPSAGMLDAQQATHPPRYREVSQPSSVYGALPHEPSVFRASPNQQGMLSAYGTSEGGPIMTNSQRVSLVGFPDSEAYRHPEIRNDRVSETPRYAQQQQTLNGFGERPSTVLRQQLETTPLGNTEFHPAPAVRQVPIETQPLWQPAAGPAQPQHGKYIPNTDVYQPADTQSSHIQPTPDWRPGKGTHQVQNGRPESNGVAYRVHPQAGSGQAPGESAAPWPPANIFNRRESSTPATQPVRSNGVVADPADVPQLLSSPASSSVPRILRPANADFATVIFPGHMSSSPQQQVLRQCSQ